MVLFIELKWLIISVAATLSRKCGVVYIIDRAVNHCGCYTE